MSKNVKRILIVVVVIVGLFIGYKFYESKHYGFLNYNLEDIYSDLEKSGYLTNNYVDDEKIDIDKDEFAKLKELAFTEVKDIAGKRLYRLQGGNSYLSIIEKDGTYYLATNSYRLKNGGQSVHTLLEDGYEHIYSSSDLNEWLEDSID